MEKFISKYNPPTKEWETLGLSALILVWKSYGIDECAGELPLSYLSKKCHTLCLVKDIKSIELSLFRMENFVVCGGGM